MHFDWTISLGALIAATVIVAGTWAAVSRLYALLDKRIAIFEHILDGHAQTLATHAIRMEKQDETMSRQSDALTRLTGDIQRVIGRMETWTDTHR